MDEKYVKYAVDKAVELLAVDSPTGFTDDVARLIRDDLAAMGYEPFLTNKGGVAVDLGGERSDKGALLVMAHVDTLGAMVARIKDDGRLKLAPIGGLRAVNVETENCSVVTADGRRYEGCFNLVDASVHVNGEYDKTPRDFDTCELTLDEDVSSADDVRALGIRVGDIVCVEPRTRVTSGGYIKSRFLDDKLSAGMVMAMAKKIKDEGIVPGRRIYLHFTVYEEVGHGASAVPEGFEDVSEVLAVDMGCVGEGLECTERQVSICVRDSNGPYDRDMILRLIAAAEAAGADHRTDIYPHYGSDAGATLRAGLDARQGLIGAGVYASHGYERSHVDGVRNTLLTLCSFCGTL